MTSYSKAQKTTDQVQKLLAPEVFSKKPASACSMGLKRPATASRADTSTKRRQAQPKSKLEKACNSSGSRSSGIMKTPEAAQLARGKAVVQSNRKAKQSTEAEGETKPGTAPGTLPMKRPATAHQVTQSKAVVQSACKVKPQAKALTKPNSHPVILSLFEEARARIEDFLGWGMLLRFSFCCKPAVTVLTQRRLAAMNQLAWPPPRSVSWISFGRNVLQLFLQKLAPIRGLANVPPHTLRSSSKPRYRVRVEHITRWAQPRGHPVNWPRRNLRTFFHTRRFVAFGHTAVAINALQCWRDVSYRWITNDWLQVFVTRTARFPWHGFQVELLEQTNEFSDADTDESASESSSSSGRDQGQVGRMWRTAQRQEP